MSMQLPSLLHELSDIVETPVGSSSTHYFSSTNMRLSQTSKYSYRVVWSKHKFPYMSFSPVLCMFGYIKEEPYYPAV